MAVAINRLRMTLALLASGISEAAASCNEIKIPETHYLDSIECPP